MQEEIDLEYFVSEISDPELGIFFAIEDDEPVKPIDGDLDSIQEALDNYGKVFLEIGYFSYDDAYEPRLMFEGDGDIIGLTDRYYDKYKFSVAGYGIFLDSELNVECGYYTTEAPSSGHGPGDTTIYDFKDAREDDVVKEKIYSLLSWTGIENSQTSQYESNHINHTEWVDRKTNLEILQNQLIFVEDIITFFTKLNKMEIDIPQFILKKFEDQLTDIKMHLDNASLSEYEITNYNFKINKIESEIISIKQKIGDNLFKRLCTEIDESYYSSLCKKISDFFSLDYETDDEILKYLCNNFPANTVYLFIFLHEPHALSSNTFDKGLHEGGVLIKLMDGTILSSWHDVVDKSNVKYVIEDLSNETNLSRKYESCTNLISGKFIGIRKDVSDMSRMFHDCKSLEDISGLSEWDVSNVVNMKGMFAACRSLVSVSGLNEWDVSNVTNMSKMFCACYSLEDISDLSKWDVSNVENMMGMFSGCWHLDVSVLSKWDVSNVENMSEMFRGCSYLVDVSSLSEWDVSNVTNMEDMFVSCGSLVSVSVLSEWDVSNVVNMNGMFEFCHSLVDISGLSEWDVSNVENMTGMFESCESLEDISGLREWDVSNVEKMVSMFMSCKSLVDVSVLSEWDVSNVEKMVFMFYGCKSLVDVSSLREWDVSNVKDMGYMFNNCSSLVSVSGLSEWDVSNVENMSKMFCACYSLEDISGLREWDVSNVTNMDCMFEDCKSLADDSILKYWSEKIN